MPTASPPPTLRSWTLADGYELRGRCWLPPTRSDPAVLYLHGIQSHGAWFEWSASLLAAEGAAVVLPDRRGSGLNSPARGDVRSFERWLEDLDELREWLRIETGAARLGVVGVSWGGKLALAWILRRRPPVDALLLIAPGVVPRVDVGAARRVAVAAALAVGGAGRFRLPLDDPELFTDEPAGQDFIRGDSLKLTRVTARFLYQSARLDRVVRRAPPNALSIPVTLVLAGRDRIIDNAGTEAQVRRVCGGGVDVCRFPDHPHTIELTARRERFAEMLRAWLAGLRENAQSRAPQPAVGATVQHP